MDNITYGFYKLHIIVVGLIKRNNFLVICGEWLGFSYSRLYSGATNLSTEVFESRKGI